MHTPRCVSFHGRRPSAWIDAFDEVWLARLAEPASLANHLDVHAGSHVRLRLMLPEARLDLRSPVAAADGALGLQAAVHACFLAAEPLLHDRRARLAGAQRPAAPVQALHAA